MANPFVRTAGQLIQLMFTWSLAGVTLEMLTSCDRPKLGDKGLRVCQMLTQHIARGNSGLILARRGVCHLFLEMDHVSDARHHRPGV